MKRDFARLSKLRSEKKLEIVKIDGKQNCADMLTTSGGLGEIDIAEAMFEKGNIGVAVQEALIPVVDDGAVGTQMEKCTPIRAPTTRCAEKPGGPMIYGLQA
jgi:hypothetical protein